MRARLIAARDRGIYVSVMLFEGWELQRTDAWKYHPFNPSNNVNAVDADADKDGKGLGYNTIERTEMGKRVLVLQEAYLRKVIETVSDLDNVLYEVCNEAGDYSTEWQYHVISFVKKEEAGRPKQHPVGMTFQWPPGKNEKLFNSPADWISPGVGEAMEYRESPPADYKGKVIVNDTDHLWGHTGGDSVWVWKSFTRGMQVYGRAVAFTNLAGFGPQRHGADAPVCSKDESGGDGPQHLAGDNWLLPGQSRKGVSSFSDRKQRRV
ncbi:MAG: hypothetical protein L0387_27080 [Acidobacteria bacterium]|nr:hypothetical protein [Acidobacteriota bacterium]